MFTFSRVLTGPRELSGGAVTTPPLSRPPGSGPPRTAVPRQNAFCSECSLLRSGPVGGAGGDFVATMTDNLMPGLQLCPAATVIVTLFGYRYS